MTPLPARGQGSPAEPKGKPVRQALEILWDRPLPAALGPAVDVRWASDNSAFLALPQRGVVEVALEPFGKRLRELIPGLAKGGLWSTSLLAATPQYLVATGPAYTVTWRRVGDPLRKEINDFDALEDVDAADTRVCVLGGRRDAQGTFAPEGAIAWLGSLDKDLKDFKPVVFAHQLPGESSLNPCSTYRLGAVRFLQDGSLVVVPGFQPGIYFLDPAGRLEKVVDGGALGLDTDCRGLSEEFVAQRAMNLPARYAWINQHQQADDILPLPNGPGFLVRRVEEGRALWRLKVLRKGGEVEEIDVPIPPQSGYSHLQADVRGKRILLLVKTFDGVRLQYDTSHLFLARFGPQ